jgi:hypothetical protein
MYETINSSDKNEGIRNAYGIFVENLKRRSHLENLGIDGRIMMNWVLGFGLIQLVRHRLQGYEILNMIQDNEGWNFIRRGGGDFLAN